VFSLVQNLRDGRMNREHVPDPALDAQKVLIRTTRSLISSGTEKMILEIAKKSLVGKAVSRPDLVKRVVRKIRTEGLAATWKKVTAKLDQPVPVGYSATGVVLDRGSGTSHLTPGTRVACAGARHANHADVIAVPHRLCVPVPDGVSDEDAAFTTVGAIAMQGVRQAQPGIGEVFVVSGLGLLGLITVQILKAAGCVVLGQDPDRTKMELARELGADGCEDDEIRDLAARITQGAGVDGVIITAATKSSAPIHLAGELCRQKGRVVVVGLVGMDVPRDLYYAKELDLRLSMSYGPGRYDPNYEERGNDYPYGYVRWTEQRNMASFLQLVSEGKVTPGRLVTHRFPFDRALEAYRLLEEGSGYIGIILEYDAEVAPTQSVRVGRALRPASGELGVAMIGAGSFAKGVLFPRIKKRGVPIIGVATGTGISAAHTAKSLGAELAATDYHEVLADDRVQVAFVLTRHHLHAQQTSDALRASKHVFVEKPLAITPAGLDQVRQAAQEGSTQIMVGFNRRFSSHARRIREALGGRGPLGMIYRVNAGRIPIDSWIQNPEEGGGRVIGEVCHFVDLLGFFAGDRPVRVQARVVRSGAQDVPDRDNLTTVIEYADGSLGTIHYFADGSGAVAKEYVEIHGGGRSAILDDFRQTTLAIGDAKQTHRSKGQDKGFDTEIDAFFESIRSGTPAIPFEELDRTTRVTFAIEESLRAGEPVEIA